MGQQQLLLIVLGLIVVGLAVMLGIITFRANAIERRRESVINELMVIANDAQKYYRKPVEILGGGNTFDNWAIPVSYRKTENGTYSIQGGTASGQSFTLIGIGNEVVTANDRIEVWMTVTPTNYVPDIKN